MAQGLLLFSVYLQNMICALCAKAKRNLSNYLNRTIGLMYMIRDRLLQEMTEYCFSEQPI